MQNFSKLGLALFIFLIPEVSARAGSAPCQPVTYEHSEYTVCEVDLRRQLVKLFWKKPDGLSTPQQKCIGWPEQKYINDAGEQGPELGAFVRHQTWAGLSAGVSELARRERLLL